MVSSLRGAQTRVLSSPLPFNILSAALVDVIVQRFAADPAIVTHLALLDETPKGDGGEFLEETLLEKVRCAVWTMLYAENAGIVSRSPWGLARMTAVAVMARQ